MSEENKENLVIPEVTIDKPVEAKAEPTAIKLPEEETTGPGLGHVADGVVGSTQVKAKVNNNPKPVHKEAEETVAIESTRNVFWDGVGKVKVGINIVSKSDADKWLTRNHIKLVSPKDVAKEFGK